MKGYLVYIEYPTSIFSATFQGVYPGGADAKSNSSVPLGFLPPGTLPLVAPVVIVVISTISVPLAEAGHIVAVVIVAGDPISTSLAIAGHYSVAVVVPCNSICSTLAKSSAHISFLLVFERLFGLLINPTSIPLVAFQGVCFK